MVTTSFHRQLQRLSSTLRETVSLLSDTHASLLLFELASQHLGTIATPMKTLSAKETADNLCETCFLQIRQY